MTLEAWIALIMALIMMIAGCLGSLIPALPSTPLVFLAALLHRIWMKEQGVNGIILLTMGILVVISLLLEYLATAVGARKLGASSKGVVGAIVGGMLGLFFGVPGILLGPLIGAVALEWLGGRSPQSAAKAGAGALMGMLAGSLGKFLISLIMLLLFVSAWLLANQ